MRKIITSSLMAALCLALTTSAFAQEKSKTTVKMNVGGFDITTRVETETETEAEEPAPPPRSQKSKKAMSNADFNQLLKAIKAESFEDDQLEVVALASQRNYFSCQQVGTLVDTVTFEDGKVTVVKHTAPRIIDPDNSHTILSHFTFSDGKAKAKQFLQR